jgi:hypothetical protein
MFAPLIPLVTIRHIRRYRWRNAQGLVQPNEIVMRKMQGNRRLQVFKLLANILRLVSAVPRCRFWRCYEKGVPYQTDYPGLVLVALGVGLIVFALMHG